MSDSFVMFTEAWSGIQLLSLEQRGLLLTALLAHQEAPGCEMPAMDPVTQAVFAMMLPRIEDSRRRYEESIEKRRQAGAKGGAAKQRQAPPSNAKSCQAKLSDAKQCQAKLSNAKHTVLYCTDLNCTDLSKRSISSKIDAAAPPLSSADASDERAPMPGTVHDDPEDTDPGVLQMQFPSPHPEQPSPLDDCPLCQEQAAPPPPPARKKTKVNLRTEDFDAWYELYPRHESKAKAAEAWDKLVKAGKLPSLDVLTAALTWQREQWDDPKYIPLPASYLRAEKWADEPRRQQPSAQRASPYFPRMSPPIEAHQDFSLPTDARGVVPKHILANL